MTLVNNVLLAIFIISGLSIIPFAIITGKYYDKLLEAKKLSKPPNDYFSPFKVMNRVIHYMYYILWNDPKLSKSGKYRDRYLEEVRDFKFRSYARPIWSSPRLDRSI